MLQPVDHPAPPTIPADLEALVRRCEAAAAAATQVAMGGMLTQLSELADAAEGELGHCREVAGEVAGDRRALDNHGEGFWEARLVVISAMHACRFAREARYWAHCYADARDRLLTGRPAFRWDDVPDHLLGALVAVESERNAMEAAQ